MNIQSIPFLLMTVHPLNYPYARILMHEWSFYIFSRCQTTTAMGQVFVKTSLPKQMLTDFSIWQDIICARGQVSEPREFCLQHKSKPWRARPKQKVLIHLWVPLLHVVSLWHKEQLCGSVHIWQWLGSTWICFAFTQANKPRLLRWSKNCPTAHFHFYCYVHAELLLRHSI